MIRAHSRLVLKVLGGKSSCGKLYTSAYHEHINNPPSPPPTTSVLQKLSNSPKKLMHKIIIIWKVSSQQSNSKDGRYFFNNFL